MSLNVQDFTRKSSSPGTLCELCSVYIPNEASLKAHLNGHKHVRNVEKQKEWTKQAECSLYVGGIKKMTAQELSIADYFSKFSSVKKITIDKTLKHYAIVELANKDAVKRALQLQQHVINGITVTVKAREVKSSVGHFQDKHAKSHSKENVFNKDLMKDLQEALSVENQIELVEEKLQLTSDDSHLRDLLCQLLQSALQEAFPACAIKQFGSSVNGFGVRGCDLDLHFEYDKLHPDILHALIAHADKTDEEKQQETTSEDDVSDSDVLLAVAEIVKQCVPDCHKIKAIVTARLPVVRFYHKASNMKCDISLANHLAVRNTAYLRYCCSSKPLFRELVFVIRAWMKYWELAGGVHVNGPRLNNYAVTLLVLFYMQHTHQMLTLDYIHTKWKGPKTIINGWDCTFPDSDAVVGSAASCGNMSSIDLLADFFVFYTKVEFSKTVIDLKSSTFIPVSELPRGSSSIEDDVMNCASKKSRMFKIGPLNIRDPFDLCHNVAGNVNEKHMKIFLKCIRNAALASKMKIYRIKPQSCDSHWGILNFFVDHHNKSTDEGKCSAQISSSGEHSFCIQPSKVGDVGDWSKSAAGFILTVLRDVFLISFNGEVNSGSSDVRTAAKLGHNTNSLMPDESSEITICQHENTETKSEMSKGDSRKRAGSPQTCCYCKRTKLMLSSPTAKQVSSNKFEITQLPYTAECTATEKMWQGRRKARRRLVQSGKSDIFQLEVEVSKLLVSDHAKHSVGMESELLNTSASSSDSLPASVFDFTLRLENQGENSLKISFLPSASDSSFTTFFHHFEAFLPNFISKCMK